VTAAGRFKVTVYASSSDRIDPAYAVIAEDLGQGIADAAEAIEQIATAGPWHVLSRDPRGGGSA